MMLSMNAAHSSGVNQRSGRAQEMVDACRRNNVLLMEAFQFRLHPQIHVVKRLIDEGKIGKVVGVAAVHSSYRPAPGNIRLSKELGGEYEVPVKLHAVHMFELFGKLRRADIRVSLLPSDDATTALEQYTAKLNEVTAVIAQSGPEKPVPGKAQIPGAKDESLPH